MSVLSSSTVEEFRYELLARYSVLRPNAGEHNDLGFRDSKLNNDTDICYYGCSNTYGYGSPIDNRWTTLIDTHKNYVSNNFGICGIGIDDIVSIFIATTKIIKMKTALFLLPDTSRQTIPFLNEKNKLTYKSMLSNFAGLSDPHELDTAKLWFNLPELYYEDRAKISIDLILHIAKLNNIKIYFSSFVKPTFDLLPADKRTKNYHLTDKLGSDKMHPGPTIHQNIANEFIELL